MFGKSEREKEIQARREENEKQRQANMAQTALQQAGEQNNGAEVLTQLSEINDLPSFPGSTLDQFVSSIASTSNLTKEDLESDHWVKQYIKVLYLARFPTRDGLKGHMRAYAFGDRAEHRKPLDEADLADIESFNHMTDMATTRSEGMKATKEATRTIAETLSRSDESDDTGGLLGWFK